MADLVKPALAAAVSMLGLSLGVTDAAAQKQPGIPTGDTQGVLIGLNKPDSAQIKSEQIKSTQIKSTQLKAPTSNQWKSPESSQIKGESPVSNQLKAPASNQLKAPSSNQIKW
jgi:hypothetical protein